MSIDRVELYKDRADEWRWRHVAANNRIVADSGEGYENYDDAYERALDESRAHAVNLEVHDLPDAGAGRSESVISIKEPDPHTHDRPA